MDNTENLNETQTIPEEASVTEVPDFTRVEQAPSQVRNGSDSPNEVPTAAETESRDITESLRLRAAAEERVRMGSEIETLLYTLPDADLRKITPEGWERVRAGESLLCTYLLCERAAKSVAAANARGERNSTGSLPTGKEDSYSMDEIRRMDRTLVRKNLDKVLRSLSLGGRKK